MQTSAQLNILVVYYHRFSYPMRTTIEDHLSCFSQYSQHKIWYYNAAFPLPAWIADLPFDAVVYHTIFLAQLRWQMGGYDECELVKRVAPLKAQNGVKILLPQDEFLRQDMIVRFSREHEVSRIFSVAPESEWEKLYPGLRNEGVRIQEVLTGYLHPRKDIAVQPKTPRDIDIGYRAWRAEYWLGRFGMLKTRIGELFEAAASGHDMRTDISTRAQDVLLGAQWAHFVLRCRYMIGVEGGSSILDFDGTIRSRVSGYLTQNPTASFEDVEAHCFPGMDGSLALHAISPRHLEACAMRTGQILVEGAYNGILRPNEHFIPLKSDFSNIDEVLQLVRDETRRQEMVECAYRDVVTSGIASYPTFVQTVVAEIAPLGKMIPKRLHERCMRLERRRWRQIQVESKGLRVLKACLPIELLRYAKTVLVKA